MPPARLAENNARPILPIHQPAPRRSEHGCPGPRRHPGGVRLRRPQHIHCAPPHTASLAPQYTVMKGSLGGGFVGGCCAAIGHTGGEGPAPRHGCTTFPPTPASATPGTLRLISTQLRKARVGSSGSVLLRRSLVVPGRLQRVRRICRSAGLHPPRWHLVLPTPLPLIRSASAYYVGVYAEAFIA